MYKYPQWQTLLAAAVLEFNPQQFSEKAHTAEQAIAARIQELKFATVNEHEVRALFDGLSILRNLKQDRLPPIEQKAGAQNDGVNS
jgi:hypothetical protein